MVSAAACEGAVAMSMSAFVSVLFHAMSAAAASCVLPVPGGPCASTRMCWRVSCRAWLWEVFSRSPFATSTSSSTEGGVTSRNGRTHAPDSRSRAAPHEPVATAYCPGGTSRLEAAELGWSVFRALELPAAPDFEAGVSATALALVPCAAEGAVQRGATRFPDAVHFGQKISSLFGQTWSIQAPRQSRWMTCPQGKLCVGSWPPLGPVSCQQRPHDTPWPWEGDWNRFLLRSSAAAASLIRTRVSEPTSLSAIIACSGV